MSEEKVLNNIDTDFRIVEVGHGYIANGVKGFSRNRYIDYSSLNQFLKETNFTSCFCTSFRYSSDNFSDIDACLIYGNLYFDFDNENNFEMVRQDVFWVINFLETVFGIKENNFNLYFSGSKGMHLTVPAEILGVLPNTNLNDIYKYIATIAKNYTPNKTIDTQIYDKKRLFRIPNTIHEKSGYYKIPLTVEEAKTLSLEKIKQMASSPRQLFKTDKTYNPTANKRYQRFIEDFERENKQKDINNKTAGKKKLSFIPPCITHILENGASVGQRNITIACLASTYKSYGESYDSALSMISDWNSRNTNPTPEVELRRTVQSIYGSQKCYGCNTLSWVSQCDENCKIFKNKQKSSTEDKDKIERQNKLKELGII